MTSKQKNLIVRTITGVLFVAIMVAGFLNAMAMMLLFCIITGLTLWEYTGLVNDHVAGTTVNRFISTIGGVYFFIAVSRTWCSGIVTGFAVLVPYVLTIVYLLISEPLHQEHERGSRLGLHHAWPGSISPCPSRSSMCWHSKSRA